MIKRVIDITDGPNYLHLEHDQMVLERQRQEIARVPCEDIGLLLIVNRQTIYSHPLIQRLLHHGAAIVFCDDQQLPCGLALPMADNALLTQRLAAQARAKLPLRKRLWRQIVRHKIRGQAANLPPDHPTRGKMLLLASEVRSGDAGNAEGLAASFYWRALLGEDFRRDPEGAPPNALLNYGYMVFRAAVARAIAAAGLHPALGLHHSNRNNPFCLADDLVEVFRPRVDAIVADLVRQGFTLIDTPAKQSMLSLLAAEVRVGDFAGPLMVALHRIVASLVRCYEGEADKLDLPALPSLKVARVDNADPELGAAEQEFPPATPEGGPQ